MRETQPFGVPLFPSIVGKKLNSSGGRWPTAPPNLAFCPASLIPGAIIFSPLQLILRKQKDMAEQQSNLRSLYSTAKQYQKQLDTLQSNSDQYQENLRAAISILEECRKLASELSLFSPNETEDDISSNDLQYLSIDYDLADLIPRTANGDRKMLLERSREAYERYLDLLDSYDMLSPSDHKLYERYREDKSHFTLLAGSDPSSKRDTKIARFKQEKGLRDKLSVRSSKLSLLTNSTILSTVSLTNTTVSKFQPCHAPK